MSDVSRLGWNCCSYLSLSPASAEQANSQRLVSSVQLQKSVEESIYLCNTLLYILKTFWLLSSLIRCNVVADDMLIQLLEL